MTATATQNVVAGMARCLVCKSAHRVEGQARRAYVGYGRYEERISWPQAETTCCGRPMRTDKIRGRVTDQPCDARCTHAKGSSCECSCGGKNHGKHAI